MMKSIESDFGFIYCTQKNRRRKSTTNIKTKASSFKSNLLRLTTAISSALFSIYQYLSF